MIEFTFAAASYIFMAAGLLTAGRLVKGPTFADRLVAGGALVNVIVVLVAIHAVATAQEFLLDLAIILMLLGFVGTLAVARFIGEMDV